MAFHDTSHDISSDLQYDDRRRHSDTPTNDNQVPSPLVSSPLISRIPQSDSGICLTPQSQASIQSPEPVHSLEDVPELTQVDDHAHHLPGIDISADSSLIHHSTSLRDQDATKNVRKVDTLEHHEGEQTWSSDNRSPTPSPGRLLSSKLGRSSGDKSSNEFTYQTKYLVLQFLHQSTTERNLLHLSQNSLSTTSESEPLVKSFAQRLRQQWQKNRSHSSPTSPEPSIKTKSFVKLKGSRSSPNLKDANFFKDMPHGSPVNRRKRTKPHSSPKPPRNKSNKVPTKRSPVLSRHSPTQPSVDISLIRSVSENTENSEVGTYISDADDELDTSFDSSQQGSTTSISFRNKLAHLHHQAHTSRLPTVHSEAESVAEGALSAAEESVLDDTAPLPFLDLSNIQPEAVPNSAHYERVNDYLDRMNESPAVNPPAVEAVEADVTLTPHNVGFDEVDSPPFHLISHPGQALLSSGQHETEHVDDGAVSGGFELNENQLEEEEGACGGADVDTVDDPGHGVHGIKADRSGLTLDLNDQDAALFIDAVHSLQQEIEEEISSFESEFEEALQNLQPDQSGHTHGLSHSRSVSPDTAEIARKLARIGDDVQVRYFDNLDRAVGRLLLDNCAGLFNYENFREAAMMALDRDLTGWKQVATLLLYSQHVALHLAKDGRRRLHRIIDYTVQLLADTAADFIIQQGGWASIAAIDQSSTPSSPENISPVHAFQPSVTTTPVATLPSTTEEGAAAHHRSSSAPELHPPPARPDQPQDTTDGMQGSIASGGGGNRETGSQSCVDAGSPDPPSVGRETVPGETATDNRDSTEHQEGEGSGETEASSAVASPAVLTGCAAAVAGIAVAVAFSIIRR